MKEINRKNKEKESKKDQKLKIEKINEYKRIKQNENESQKKKLAYPNLVK